MQSALFFDDEFVALTLMVAHGTKTRQQLAAHLWPAMKPESRYAKLSRCLSEDGDERLSFGQVLEAMRFCESYEPLYYASDETLHARPERRAPADERLRLLHVVNNAASTLERAMKRIDEMKGAA